MYTSNISYFCISKLSWIPLHRKIQKLLKFLNLQMLYFDIPINILQFYSRKRTPISTMGILPSGYLDSNPHLIAFLHFDVSMWGWRKPSIVTPSIGIIICKFCYYWPRKGIDSIHRCCKDSGSIIISASSV